MQRHMKELRHNFAVNLEPDLKSKLLRERSGKEHLESENGIIHRPQ